MASTNNFPKLHNAAWPGVVGKGDDGDPTIELEKMLDLTAAAQVDGVRFDGVDLFLFAPHVDIDATDDDLKDLAESVTRRDLVVGTVVAPVWPPTGGGSAMGRESEREQFLTQVRKGCRIAKTLRELGVRPYGAVRIDSAAGPADWSNDPEASQKQIAETFREACTIAEDHGEKLTAEGEICWGGMHSWKKMADLLNRVDRPQTLGFQADMAHTYLYLLGYNAPEDALLEEGYSEEQLHAAYRQMTDVLRPWTNDFHVAQNDGTVFGSGSHDKTGRHCLATDPEGKLDIVAMAGYWLRENGPGGEPHRRFEHICWDGCMFPNDVMMKSQTWNDILGVMVAVRDEHGWQA